MAIVTLKLEAVCIDKFGVKYRRIPFSSNKTMHWATRHKWVEAWQKEVGIQFQLNRKAFGRLPLKFARITVNLWSIQEIDKDNRYNACKPLIDAFKVSLGNTRIGTKVYPKPGLGIIIDDKEKYVDWTVNWMKAKNRLNEYVEIIFELP